MIGFSPEVCNFIFVLCITEFVLLGIEMVAIPLLPFQEGIQSEHFRFMNSTPELSSQPPARKAPRKPAPPVPPLNNPSSAVAGQELLKTNNNDYYEEGSKISPLPLARSSSQKPSFRNSAFVIGSSSETIDSCGSRSPIQNGDIGSLDRRSVIRRNSSERRPASDRYSVSNYRASKLIGKPNVAPPSVPRRPNIPPPERPGRTPNELSRQRSVDNIFDGHSSHPPQQDSTMSKSFCVRSSSHEDETKDVKEEETGGDEVGQVENNVIQGKLNTGIETPECEKNGEETLVTSRINSCEDHEIPVCKEMCYETKIAALPVPRDVTCESCDVNSNTTTKDLSPTDQDTASMGTSSDDSLLHKSSSQELSSDQFKVKPPKPLPPPIKPRITSLNEASRL